MIVSFPDLEFKCIRHSDGYSFTLCEDWEFLVNGKRHVIERGFYSDSVTIPKFLGFLRFPILFFIPRTGIYLPAVLIHDWLTKDGIHGSEIDWKLANDVFAAALQTVGTMPIRRHVMTLGVNLYAKMIK